MSFFKSIMASNKFMQAAMDALDELFMDFQLSEASV